MSSRDDTERGRRAFMALVAYFVLAIAANAVTWWVRFDDRALENRPFDYGWEISLPWRALQGEWVGRDFAFPIGPLWQALAALPNLAGEFSALRSVIGMHVVFPLLSLAAAGAIALGTFRDWPRRAAAFGALALLSLHDDVRTFRAVASLAIVVAYAPLEGDRAPGRRPLIAALAVLVLSLLSFDVAVLAVASLIAMAAVELGLGDRRIALRRFGRCALALAVLGLLLSGVLALAGGSLFGLLAGALGIVRAYAVAMVGGAQRVDVPALVLFVLMATACALAVLPKRRRDLVTLLWLAGSAPLALRAVFRTDPEHVYAGMMPLAGVLVLVALRHARERRAGAACAGLTAITFALGWFGAHRDRPAAWKPTAFWQATLILAGEQRREEGYAGDLPRIASFVASIENGAACVGLPFGAEVVHALTSATGPTETELYWSPAMREKLAGRIRQARCPWYVDRVRSFDTSAFPLGASVGFGPDRLVISELYEPERRLGPATFASRLRATPAPIAKRPLAASNLGPHELEPRSRIELVLERPVSFEHALAIDYTLEVSALTLLAGRAPDLLASFSGADGPAAAPAAVSLELNARTTAIVPVHPEIAEWRWIAGRRARTPRSADRLSFEIGARGRPIGATRLTIHSIAELVPPPAQAEPPAPGCDAELDLVARARERGLPRAASVDYGRDFIGLPPNAPGERLAELFVPVVACEDSCLLAELFVDAPIGTGDGVDFELHLMEGAERPRVLSWHVDPGISPRPAVIPLAPWAGRRVLVRLGTVAGATTVGDDARFERPRIARCRALDNLVHALHDGAHQVVRGKTRVLGDTLELEPEPRGAPVTEVRMPVRIPRNACLAIDFQVRGRSPASVGVGIEAAVLRGDESIRIARAELEPGAPLESLSQLSLQDFAGQELALRFAAWPLREGEPGLGVILRPRLHRCGDLAAWDFDRR